MVSDHHEFPLADIGHGVYGKGVSSPTMVLKVTTIGNVKRESGLCIITVTRVLRIAFYSEALEAK